MWLWSEVEHDIVYIIVIWNKEQNPTYMYVRHVIRQTVLAYGTMSLPRSLKTIKRNSVFWMEFIMCYYSRVHEVRYFYVKSPASSYIKWRLLMYELAGRHPSTSLTLIIEFMHFHAWATIYMSISFMYELSWYSSSMWRHLVDHTLLYLLILWNIYMLWMSQCANRQPWLRSVFMIISI
jgi:hypothetical protein